MIFNTTQWFILVILLCVLLMGIGVVFLFAALDRNQGRSEQAEQIRQTLWDMTSDRRR